MKYSLLKEKMDIMAHYESKEFSLRECRVKAYGETYNVFIGHMNPNKLTQVFIFLAKDDEMKEMEFVSSNFIRWIDGWSTDKFLLQAISVFRNKQYPDFEIDVIHKCITVALIDVDDEIAIHAMYDASGEDDLSFVPVHKDTGEAVDWEIIKCKY